MQVDVSDLSFSIKNKLILKDINLKIKEKSSIGIIGPNGSGKSTFLKCVYRVLSPNFGTIFIDGKSIKEYSFNDTAKKMAVVAQHTENQFDFNVLEMVLLGRSPHKKFMESDNAEDIETAKNALIAVDMAEFENRNFASLSGGEKQRVILARALAQQTECLILDEPTNHLDIKHQIKFMNVAKNLGGTVISVIHDLNIALMYCDFIYALKDGKIIASGIPNEVITENLIENLYGVKSQIIYNEKFEALNVFYSR